MPGFVVVCRLLLFVCCVCWLVVACVMVFCKQLLVGQQPAGMC
jgi:hypothetical protein